MKKVLVVFLLVSLLSLHFLKSLIKYNKESESLKKIKIEKQKLINKEKREIVKVDEFNKYEKIAIKDSSEFLKKIYGLIRDNNLKLINCSSSVVKKEENGYVLEYISFKIEGALVDFYSFLYHIYHEKMYIDTSYTTIEINAQDINIDFGYVIKGDNEVNKDNINNDD